MHFPFSGWDTFPSRDLPKNYNFGSVYYYLVETMPQYEEEDGEEESSGDEDVVTTIEIQDPFDNDENDLMLRSKKIRRGLTYYKSNFIRSVKDTIVDRVHYIKGHVRASMNKTAYWVKIALSQISGSVAYCECDKECAGGALGRCSHVGALLLYILGHMKLNGYSGKSYQLNLVRFL